MNARLSAPLACALLAAIACGTGCPGPSGVKPSDASTATGSGKVRAPGTGTGGTGASSNPGGTAITPSTAPSTSAAPTTGPSATPAGGGTPGPSAQPSAAATATPSAGPTATTFQFFAADLPISQNAGAGGGAVARLADDGKSFALKFHVVGATGALTGAHVRLGQANQTSATTSVHDFAIADDQRSGTTSWRDTSAAPLNAERLNQLKTGQLFVAADTTANPNGEARGQLVGFAQAYLAELALVPGVSAPQAKGAAWAAVDGAGKVTVKLYTAGLTGPLTMAHLHNGAAGESGPIVKDLVLGADQKTATVTWSTGDASQPLTQGLLDALKAGKIYVAGHTPQNAAGEIRGQLLAP